MQTETTAILEKIGQMQRSLAELKASLRETWSEDSVPQGEFEVFVCRARQERYGLPIEKVEEVLPMCKLTDYPEGPTWFSGVLNLRGDMIPVVDVSARIDRAKRPIQTGDFIVVVNMGSKKFGLVFQEVFSIQAFRGGQVQPPVGDVPEAPYIIGIVETGHSPVFILSLSSLIGTSDIPVNLL